MPRRGGHFLTYLTLMLSNYINTVKSFYKRHFWDIALILIVLLAIAGLVGIWRLYAITPQKTPIRIDSGY